MPTFDAVCRREGRFWVIDVEGVGVTQARIGRREIVTMARDLIRLDAAVQDAVVRVWGARLIPDVYRRRWQYHWPWAVTRPWLPRAGRGSDEWCNPSVYVVLPLLGMVVVFWRPGRMRGEADGPCAECLAADERDRAAGWNVIR